MVSCVREPDWHGELCQESLTGMVSCVREPDWHGELCQRA